MTIDAAWLDLLGRALEGNPFLAPWFLKPALRWLDPGAEVDLLLVERFEDGRCVGLEGLLPLRAAPPATSLPLPHLALYRPVHAYAGGVLVAMLDARPVLSCMFEALADGNSRGAALRLEYLRRDGPLAREAREAIRGRAQWFATRRVQRAALRPAARSPGRERETRAAARLRRGERSLERELGPVSFHALRGAAVDADAIERHLRLESLGWKGRSGSAMLSDPAQAAFFRELAAGAARAGAALFCELHAGGQVVASTSNFLAGGDAVAFKLGWDPACSSAGPGLLVDDALRRHAASALQGVRLVDGCAEAGSYLERVWPNRIRVEDGYLAWGWPERSLLAAYARGRKIRDALRPRPRD